ncbi:hypothetical protein ACEXOS_021935 [Herbiconiux sp. P16]|uniref:hypothetical protein n=1 Tax=Herbiconiux wuyangfengii TaxID=3342794 RepID=UPI0035BA8CA8
MSEAATIAAPPAAAGSRRPGRTRITSKALSRIVSAVTAEALDVTASRVGVELADQRGLLTLVVTTPIRVVSLDRVLRERGAVDRTGGSILDRTARAQETIRDRVGTLTGSAIGRVTVRVSGVDIQPGERVR